MVIRGDEYLVITARDLGAALKHFRTAAGVTQADAAEAAGVGQPYLSSLEGGKFGSSLTHAAAAFRWLRGHRQAEGASWLTNSPHGCTVRRSLC
jgi:transcriptional regulator with XRE-family HTH domain